MSEPFRVGLTQDFRNADGKFAFGDVGLGLLDAAPGVEWEILKDGASEIGPEAARDYDALLVLAPRVSARTVEHAERLAIVARFGVGYDSVDLDACTRNGVVVTITPDGVRRPVASSAVTFILALAHQLPWKDRITRQGRWAEKSNYMGTGLTGRTLGLIGLGNIGREIVRLITPFDLKIVAFDPFVLPDTARDVGVELVDLPTLLTTADFVCVCCQLTPETHHLLNAERLQLMKPTAYVVNVARGPIVDQRALTRVLRERRIRGAAIDVFEQEPVDPNDPILALDNVIVAPHAICWTDECFLGNGRSACQSILDIASGRVPRYVVNRDAIEQPSFHSKLERYAERGKTN